MVFLLQTLTLSVGVTLRMIMPTIFILIASMVVWLILGILTLGFSGYVSASITIAFLTLYGMRTALELWGERSPLDLKMLALYSAVFGVILEICEQIGFFGAKWAAVFAAKWNLDFAPPLQDLKSAEESLQFAFGLNALSFYALFALIIFASIQTAFAIPMAAAARSAGTGQSGHDLFNGFGKGFFRLFPIFLVSFFFQFFFKLYGLIILALGLFVFRLLRWVDDIGGQIKSSGVSGLELFGDVSPTTFLYPIAGMIALVWLQSLVSSAAALALVRDNGGRAVKTPAADPTQAAQFDIRALRKARQ